MSENVSVSGNDDVNINDSVSGDDELITVSGNGNQITVSGGDTGNGSADPTSISQLNDSILLLYQAQTASNTLVLSIFVLILIQWVMSRTRKIGRKGDNK